MSSNAVTRKCDHGAADRRTLRLDFDLSDFGLAGKHQCKRRVFGSPSFCALPIIFVSRPSSQEMTLNTL
jgi:hypothetical protein